MKGRAIPTAGLAIPTPARARDRAWRLRRRGVRDAVIDNRAVRQIVVVELRIRPGGESPTSDARLEPRHRFSARRASAVRGLTHLPLRHAWAEGAGAALWHPPARRPRPDASGRERDSARCAFRLLPH